MTPDEPLSTGQAAKHLRVSTVTLRRWAHDGLIPHTVLPNGRLRFSRADLDAALKHVPASVA